MPTYQTTGIVIGRTNFGEADRIIRLITAEQGKLSAVARGVRKIKSRTAGHLELFGEVKLMLATGRGNLDIITSAQLTWYPHQLANDYQRLEQAYTFAKLIDQVAQEHHAQPELYAHWREALVALDGGASGPLVELWFKLRLLSVSGLRPELGHCLICGRSDEASDWRFDTERGGLTCASDAGATSRPISPAAIKLWRLLVDYPYTTISHIADGPALARDTLAIGDEFVVHHLGR